MKLRTKKSHFQNLPEEKTPRHILPILLKFFYYLMLLGVLGGLGYVVAMRYIYFTGRGQVEIEKIKISSRHGGTIQSIRRQVGEIFAAGDLLAEIYTGIECPTHQPDLRPVRLAHEIKLKQSQLDIYSNRKKALEAEVTADILPRALEIGDAFTIRKNHEVQRETKLLKEKIDLLAAEIAIKREELAALKKALTNTSEAFCGLEMVETAFAGSVYRVIHQPSEYVGKGEPFLIVTPEASNVFIEAYFDEKHIQYLVKGQTLVVEFPDRTTSKGEIVDYSSSASYAADRTLKDYLPVEARLRVDLKPINPSEAVRWRRYDRMDVIVRGER